MFHDRIRRLNGWQRLWLVLAALWLPLVWWNVAPDFPTEADRPSYERGYLQHRQLLDLFQSQASKVLTLDEKMARAAEANRAIDEEMRDARLAVLGKGVAMWLGPVVGLYLLGIAFVWVMNGFRGRR